ncbi:hypothetical protein HHI36_019413 [Cryptolaemus montrouzieri]|uniref:HTH psq-type domain-containing protein n=1 Tax=Cryptolaemus montrouzieri TaxID=559131 RepID=A0ABD2P2U0_9CUCU
MNPSCSVMSRRLLIFMLKSLLYCNREEISENLMFSSQKMPKFKERKTTRGSWDENTMERAIRSAQERNLSIRRAAERYGVPRSTLQDKIKAIGNGEETEFKPKLGRLEHTFSNDQALQLHEYVIDLDNRLMPLTKAESLKLKLKIPHRFNKGKRMAVKDFYYSFSKRLPDIALRTPESTSI